MLPFGLYEQVINEIIRKDLEQLGTTLVQINTGPIDSAESSKILAEYFGPMLRKVLDYIEGEKEAVENRVELCNQLIACILTSVEKSELGFRHGDEIARQIKQYFIHQDAKMLLSLVDRFQNSSHNRLTIVRPDTPVAENALFTGASHEPSMVSELKKEIQTCDRIELLVSFIKWSGLRLIMDELTEFTQNGGELRIITTSYMGATDVKSIEELRKLPNTRIKVSYDTKRTRLHAKTYVFYRNTGFSTAYVGSSNLTNAAISSGLEWNVKVTKKDLPETIDKIAAAFESYWNSKEFEYYSEDQKERLSRALRA